jgi:hypothetical protein
LSGEVLTLVVVVVVPESSDSSEASTFKAQTGLTGTWWWAF